jgi:diguanylate cyclase (GGDEF)-like protein
MRDTDNDTYEPDSARRRGRMKMWGEQSQNGRRRLLTVTRGLAEIVRRTVLQTTPRDDSANAGHYLLAIDAANDGLWDWNLATNAMSFSSRWRALLGLEAAVVGNGPEEWFGRVHVDDSPRLEIELSRLLRGDTESIEFECRMRHSDGVDRTMIIRALAARDSLANVRRVGGSHTDVTIQRMTEARLRHGALHDSLTNLPNRQLFRDRLQHAFDRAVRGRGASFAILFVDIDHFKSVNDGLGHQAGDQLLVSVAGRLRECVRASDTLARLGGDEFAVLAEQVRDVEQVVALATRMLAAVARVFHVGGQNIATTASIGIAFGASYYKRSSDVLRDADSAMYRAKALGRARYEVFSGPTFPKDEEPVR